MRPALFALLACRDPASTTGPAPDLGERLGADEARAGVVVDEAVLFGGVSAEGRAGDVKIYNDRVQFVIQGVRAGGWYVQEGGGVIDADLVRPEGQPGRDLVDEWMAMAGFGRLLRPERVEVVADGTAGGAALVRVSGGEAPLGLLAGVLETPTPVPDLGLELVTEYRLAPGSWLLEVTTTVTSPTAEELEVGDMLQGSLDAARTFTPGTGYLSSTLGTFPWTGFVGERNEAALGVVAGPGATLEQTTAGQLLASLAEMATAFNPPLSLEPGVPTSWTRSYGVAPDPAVLTEAALAVQGGATQEVTGVVTAPDGPVEGARVSVAVDGAAWSLAFTAADGSFRAVVPEGPVDVLAEGRGPGRFVDLPAGAGAWSPYAAPAVEEAVAASFRDGAGPIPLAHGRGVAPSTDPLVLGAPARLTLRAADGLPFEARVYPADARPLVDDSRVRGRPPGGTLALGWALDGELSLEVEPGPATLVLWRGTRHELVQQAVNLEGGQELVVDVELPEAFPSPAGWVRVDPHQHAAPSGDGSCLMEERLAASAATGLAVHVGTDHDHVADYRPLVAAMGLDDHLTSVVGDEVSPVSGGHVNVWPVEPSPGEPNAGAYLWWVELTETTAEWFAAMRADHPDAAIQLNHPLDAGVGEMARWSPGVVERPERWSDDFDAVEVLNAGDYDTYLAFWLDLALRGILSAPVGVSDSHSPVSGDPGLNLTWMRVGVERAGEVTEQALRQALADRATVPSLGIWLEADPEPGSAMGAGQRVVVTARAPSWVAVDRVSLWRDGELVEEVAAARDVAVSFTLDTAVDALFYVTAHGDTPLPVFGDLPWAMTSPWLVDVAGDGWTPPLPPLAMD